MKKTIWMVLVAVAVVACGGSDTAETTTPTTVPTTARVEVTSTSAAQQMQFPVTVSGSNGDVTIEAMPQAIVSISPTATEMLFAVGADTQIVAVDEYSYFPAEAPVTDLSGFTPNLEAIAAFDPDLVIVADDIDGLVGALVDLGIPTLQLSGLDVVSMEDVYDQIITVGTATGHADAAETFAAGMRADVAAVIDSIEQPANPLTYYHELDSTFYTVTSSTFIGSVYSLFGLENIADAADPDGTSFGYPQLSEEFILEADPDFVFLTDCCGDTADSVAARPGWGDLTAVANDSIVVFDGDVSSRWGPRLVDFIAGIGQAIDEKSPA